MLTEKAMEIAEAACRPTALRWVLPSLKTTSRTYTDGSGRDPELRPSPVGLIGLPDQKKCLARRSRGQRQLERNGV